MPRGSTLENELLREQKKNALLKLTPTEWRQKLVECMSLDPHKEWSVQDFYDLLGLDGFPEAKACVRAAISTLRRGSTVEITGKGQIYGDGYLYRLLRAQPLMLNPPTITKEKEPMDAVYAVISQDKITYEGTKDECLELISDPELGGRLFREVKLKVKVEVDK